MADGKFKARQAVSFSNSKKRLGVRPDGTSTQSVRQSIYGVSLMFPHGSKIESKDNSVGFTITRTQLPEKVTFSPNYDKQKNVISNVAGATEVLITISYEKRFHTCAHTPTDI